MFEEAHRQNWSTCHLFLAHFGLAPHLVLWHPFGCKTLDLCRIRQVVVLSFLRLQTGTTVDAQILPKGILRTMSSSSYWLEVWGGVSVFGSLLFANSLMAPASNCLKDLDLQGFSSNTLCFRNIYAVLKYRCDFSVYKIKGYVVEILQKLAWNPKRSRRKSYDPRVKFLIVLRGQWVLGPLSGSELLPCS